MAKSTLLRVFFAFLQRRTSPRPAGLRTQPTPARFGSDRPHELSPLPMGAFVFYSHRVSSAIVHSWLTSNSVPYVFVVLTCSTPAVSHWAFNESAFC
ncbi:Hypothetical protein NTJ_02493 [Nesidiocoris tenuis]|uniref:Secreted protein n=1 Tax=Nesidiocoris tenuis TaxID=355587 RepID=A0ABN7AFR5_9HEMI|nr:Hypothetical protein NTJ_02493 [Nesidiocoris tenuis]